LPDTFKEDMESLEAYGKGGPALSRKAALRLFNEVELIMGELMEWEMMHTGLDEEGQRGTVDDL
jgi:hypothetical protein